MKMNFFSLFLFSSAIICCYSTRINCTDYSRDALPWDYFNFGTGQVTIKSGQNVLLNKEVILYGGLVIESGGKLWFDLNSDIKLETQHILLKGELHIGSEQCLYSRKARIILKDGYSGPDVPSDTVHAFGKKVLAVSTGGLLEIHGSKGLGLGKSWTKLDDTVQRGENTILLMDQVDWQVGDEIVVASTDYHFGQAEKRKIIAISGDKKKLTLDQPFVYMHFGKITYGVDERAEVGLLSRSVVIEGTYESIRGGHFMIQKGFSQVHIEGLELYNMGQGDEIGRYPVHFHFVGEAPSGTYVRDTTVHKSNFRCFVIHASHNILLQNNVAYDNFGHCYFTEDGVEYNNTLIGNLGLVTKSKKSGARFGSEEQAPTTFWITNPRVTLINNVAAGSEHTGIWYLFCSKASGLSYRDNVYPGLENMHKWKLYPFVGNVAHSCGVAGVMFEPTNYGGDVDTGLQPSWIQPFLLYFPEEEDGNQAWTISDRMTIYKIRQKAFWTRGSKYLIINSNFGDNEAGVTLATTGTHLMVRSVGITENCLFVGFTENVGDWYTPLPGDYLPSPITNSSTPRGPGIPRRGYQFYDGPQRIIKSKFINYKSDIESPHSALGYFYFNTWQNAVTNSIFSSEFINSNYYWLMTREDQPPLRLDGDTNAGTFDGDGYLTGHVQSWVLNDYPWFTTDQCIKRKDWYASICPHRYANVWLENLNTPETRKNGLDLTLGSQFSPTLWIIRDQHIGDNHNLYKQSLYGLPSVNQFGERYRYQILAMIGASYTICYPSSPLISFQLNNVKKGDSIRYGIYYSNYISNPSTQVKVTRGLYQIGDPHSSPEPSDGIILPLASSLNDISFSKGESYFWDSQRQLLFINLVQRYDLKDGDDYCPREGCEIVWIRTSLSSSSLNSNYTSSLDFCSPSAYPFYQITSGGIFDEKLKGMEGIPEDPYWGLNDIPYH